MFVSLVLTALKLSEPQTGAQQTTAFSYQGRVQVGGVDANGPHTRIFSLFDGASGGQKIAHSITNLAMVTNGFFSVNLDFGNGAFNGGASWLDLTISSGGTNQALSSRIQILPVPYAQWATIAGTVTNSGIMNSQLAASAVATINIQDGSVTANKLGALAVAAPNIQAGAVTSDKLGALAVASINLQSGAVTAGKLGLLAVATSNLQPQVVTSDKLAFDANGLAPVTGGAGYIIPNGDPDHGKPLLRVAGAIDIDSFFHIGGNLSFTGSNGYLGFLSGAQLRDDRAGGLNVSANNIHLAGTLQVDGSVTANGVVLTSDRNAKENFTGVNGQDVLAKVFSLPMTEWNYKTEPANMKHIGPMAQDFHKAFQLNGADDKHISIIDEGGVALAAIQGLSQRLSEKEAELEVLKVRLEKLEKLISEKSMTK